MKILKIILSVVIILIALFFVVALFMPTEYRVERSVTIAASDSMIWAQIADFKNRPSWDPWVKEDPTASFKVSNPSSGVGAGYSWADGEIIGSGSITIIDIEPLKSIKSKLAFTEPQSGESDVWWKIESVPDGFKVSWGNGAQLSYPMERYLAGMIESMVGESFDKGLANIKSICETIPADNSM